MRRCGSIMALLGASAGLALTGLAAPAFAGDPPPITVEYQGTIDETSQPPDGFSGQFHVQWDFVWDVHVPLVVPAWRIKTLTGTVSAVLPPPNQSASCTGTLSDNPAMPALSYQFNPELEVLAGKHDLVQVSGHAPNSLLSSSPQTPFGFCGNTKNETGWAAPSPQPTPDPTQPGLEYKLGGGSRTERFDEDWTQPRDGVHFVLKSTLTVNGSAPPLPSTPKAVRDASLAALRGVVTQTFYPCLTTAAGVVVFFSTGVLGVVAGGTMAAIAGPLCVNGVALLANLQKTYKDPPVAGYRTPATVIRHVAGKVTFPSCSGKGKKVAAACTRMHALALAWATATQRSQESSLALATTVGRESAAGAANDTAAQSLQTKTALKLLPTLQRDLRAQTAAGAALATALRLNGVSGRITRAQTGQAIENVVQRLDGLGVTRADLEQGAAAQLKPRALNLLTVLSERLS